MTFLDWLNRYANLLLVLVTGAYVWLTWQNIRALQRASLRERELRHLDDIKQYVIRPLIDWIDSEAVRKLTGQNPLIQVKSRPVPNRTKALGEWSYDYPRQLESTLEEPRGISSSLLSHARKMHFHAQLTEFEAFRKTVAEVAFDCAALARGCADRSASSTSLRRAALEGREPESADSDTLVQICLRDIILGHPKPQVGFQSTDGGILLVTDGYTGGAIARGPTEGVRSWAESGVARIQDEWVRSGLQGKIEALLKAAANVRETLEATEFTYALREECEYVGGKKT
jgi:hypothetical protein